MPLWRSGSPGWKPPPLARLAPELAAANPEALRDAALREVRRRTDALFAGIERYRRHPYRRPPMELPILWREGGTVLHDYRPEGGRPVLFVPSLVNRGYVLDLTAERSLLRFLAGQGFRPLLIEWGAPGATERNFTLAEYVAGRLERALDAAVDAADDPPVVVGYCMGGLLAAALAQRRPQDVRAVAFLATPWDFHADGSGQGQRLAAAMAPSLPLVAAWGELPVDGIQALFAALDPLQVVRKFMAFAAVPEGSAKETAFVALEDWLNDGVPLAAPVAVECLSGWYGENTPARGLWRVAGAPVRPERLRLPSLHLVPSHDRIVPPESARALASAMPDAEVMEPPLGHIGMVVSGRAETEAWRPLASWLERVS